MRFFDNSEITDPNNKKEEAPSNRASSDGLLDSLLFSFPAVD